MTQAGIILLIASFTLSVCLTALVRKIALGANFVSRPSTDRYNQRIVPLGGGIAIFTTISIVLVAAIIIVKFFIAQNQPDWLNQSIAIHTPGFITKINQLIIVLCCTFTLFMLGLLDDKKNLGPFTKLIVQFIVALIAAAFADIRAELFIHNKIITSILSAFWIVLIINCFNFLDNMDGASAGIACIAACILLTAAILSKQVFVSATAILLIGTLFGFLVFNFPPAKIFAGDAGSMVIGFFIALLTLRTTYYQQSLNGSWYPVLLPLIVMAVPLYDFLSVIFLRISQGKNPFIGDTQHFSHRLKNRGLTETQTVLTLYLATLCTGLSAIFLYQINLTGAILIFLQTLMILAIIAILESTSTNERNDK